MHIRYKQSCLIILRHISDRVINKHCKINEEKCDLQFPLIGKALAGPRHKVTALGLRTGRDRDEGRRPLSVWLLPRPALPWTPTSGILSSGGGALGGPEAGLTVPRPLGPRPPASVWRPHGTALCHLGGLAQPWALERASRGPSYLPWAWAPRHLPWAPRLGDAGPWAGPGTPAWPPPCSEPPALEGLLCSLPYIVRAQLPPAIFSPLSWFLSHWIQQGEPTPPRWSLSPTRLRSGQRPAGHGPAPTPGEQLSALWVGPLASGARCCPGRASPHLLGSQPFRGGPPDPQEPRASFSTTCWVSCSAPASSCAVRPPPGVV